MRLTAKMETDIHALRTKYPAFRLFSNLNNGIFIFGSIELKDTLYGFIWEKYDIKILLPCEYPFKTPRCYLVSKNISWTSDRHIDKDGRCCLVPTLEEYIILGEGYDLINYIEKLVIPFFAAQKLFDLEGKWPNGEYSHFSEGLIEYYLAKLSLKNKKLLIPALMILAGEQKLGRNDECFCTSGKKYKKCHLSLFEHFPLIYKNIFKKDLSEIKEAITNGSIENNTLEEAL